MTSTVRRAGAFAVVGTIALAAPLLGRAAAAPFALIAAVAVLGVEEGRLFELFARPGDREDRRLNGLIGFALAAAGLGILAAATPMPQAVFVGTVLLVGYGNLAARTADTVRSSAGVRAVGFVLGGTLACWAGLLATRALAGGDPVVFGPEAAVLATTGALLGATVRTVLFEDDDPVVMLSVGLALWLLSTVLVDVTPREVAIALAVTAALGYVSYALETASVTGMLTGVLLALVTIVLGGYGWFGVLIAFFGLGGLATKYGYDRKDDRGVAEDNDGARGSANVLGNAAVALAAVVGYAAAGAGHVPVESELFLFAFLGSLATAMSDTLSSEIGGVYDDPRLITTLERVEPGTDGAVTWQGELAGIVGAAVVAGIAVVAFGFAPGEAGLVVVAGVAGMTVDSIVGATIEGDLVGNQTVNLIATLSGAAVAVGAVVLV